METIRDMAGRVAQYFQIKQTNHGEKSIQVANVHGDLTIVQGGRPCWETQSCWQQCGKGRRFDGERRRTVDQP